MKIIGTLHKMKTEWATPVKYYQVFEDEFVALNQLIGHELSINFEGYECLSCGLPKKIFRQGFCYDCYQKIPEAGDWIFRPELSKAHLEIEDRDLAYETKVQLQPHIVYLALSGGLKVGVTRKTQVPTRWIDQGASSALVFLEVPNRYLAGVTEVVLKEHLSDKTNWRLMLQNRDSNENLSEIAFSMKPHLPDEVLMYFDEKKMKSHQITYPVMAYPSKVSSLNLEKTSTFKGRLTGIRGQYLLFENGIVFNVRNHEGFVVSIEI
ncbi:MAG: DUF2797 domain-containing protein [Flavobacteriales bacterium CG_4_9_14_3_um_filter_40_17]|nr:MAG: DUF2797 domain-containing protein [Flavobacteriales bacterium CG_4_9_14_3_um_filter_40_17]